MYVCYLLSLLINNKRRKNLKEQKKIKKKNREGETRMIGEKDIVFL